MVTMIVEFEWDEQNLGPAWMNIDNLSILLYTDAKTKLSLLRVRQLGGSLIVMPNADAIIRKAVSEEIERVIKETVLPMLKDAVDG